jgi:LuxR family maltose regulon positive regulatory protein
MARICFEWNDLQAAQQHGQQGLQLARQTEQHDRIVSGELLLARLKRAQGDIAGAAELVAAAAQVGLQHHVASQMPEVVSAQVLVLLDQGRLAEAAHLAQTHDLPISQARTHLAQGNAAAALAALESLRQRTQAQGWEIERLRAMTLQALACHAHGATDEALRVLGEALALAEPGGFVRTFLDEGAPMARLLSDALAHGIRPEYTTRLLATFDAERPTSDGPAGATPPPIDALSQRELEVLRLVAQGLSNRAIGDRLFLAVDTVKGHNRVIFSKLQVGRRTEAVARARELNLI